MLLYGHFVVFKLQGYQIHFDKSSEKQRHKVSHFTFPDFSTVPLNLVTQPVDTILIKEKNKYVIELRTAKYVIELRTAKYVIELRTATIKFYEHMNSSTTALQSIN
ncbi:hypothetical protein GJ496_011204 [Pomphorhynchus laevis]|nr:hypothetical protein GJ496_011204 [Pomphorhynchus laevis]